MANSYKLSNGGEGVLKNVSFGGLTAVLYVAILLYILYNSSLLPPISLYGFGQPVFRSSKERRKARLREARASKCSSGDSGDSGIEIVGSSGVLNPSDLSTDGHFTHNSIFHVSVDDPIRASDGGEQPSGAGGGPAPLTAIKIIGSGSSCNGAGPWTNGSSLSGGQNNYSSCPVVANGTFDSISSSPPLESSTNTSVTTISYGGPSLSSVVSGGVDTNTTTTAEASSSFATTNGIFCPSNRNSFHVSPPFIHSHAASSTAKIRRCQSDVAHGNGGGFVRLGGAAAGGGLLPNNNICTGNIVGGQRIECKSNNCCNLASVHRQTSHDEETINRTKSLKRSQGSTHLRRSVSQPLDLNKSLLECSGGSFGSSVVCGPGGAGSVQYPQRRPHRRPSTGNLLSEDHTTSEEDMNGSDNEDTRRDRDMDEACGVVYAEALWDHVTLDSEELVFRAGELLTVVDRTDEDWWWGRVGTRAGWFPVAFVRLLVNQQEHLTSSQDLILVQSECELGVITVNEDDVCDVLNTTLTEDEVSNAMMMDAASRGHHGLDTSTSSSCSRQQYSRAVSQYSTTTTATATTTINNNNTPRKASVSGLSHDQIRANVIKEIITTERDFVKHLRDVVEGYLKQSRRRPDMFSSSRISAIFGNMEELYVFQTTFLEDLESCINWDTLHESCVGEAFIKNSEKFEIYSEYCNNHPFAVSELQELYQQEKYVHFFEACRLLQEMINISLDGFLLTPVQKICKYPLQLQELLKYTKPEHSDYTSVQGALNAMRAAALLVNERRRRMECLEKIAAWQMALEGWEGPELLDGSSQLIHQGEVIKGAGGAWPKEVTLFLFDRQLVYCKKDIIKRNTFVYRGRINLDQCTVEDIQENKDGSRSGSLPTVWKIHCRDKNKSYVFASKTQQEKDKWLDAFKRERELVAGDEEAGFLVSNKTRDLAREAARTRRSRPKKPRTSKVHNKRSQALTHAQAEQLVNIDRELRSNSLPSHQQQQLQQQQQQPQQQHLSNTAPLPPADTSDSKRRGLWFSFGGQKKSRSQTRGDTQQPTPV